MESYKPSADYRARVARVDETRSLGEQITELAGHINAATYRFLMLIAEFDRRGGWSDGATQSCAHWLNWKCGIGFCAAREKVRTARALEGLPKISAAMERGEVSYSKVRELTRVACHATEEYLLMIAIHGTAQHVERLVRYYRRAQESEELSREERQQANRSLQYWFDEDGSMVIKGRLSAQAGALLKKAIELAVDEFSETAPASGANPPTGVPTVKFPPSQMRRADALELLAETFLQHGAAAMSGGDKHQIVIHVDAETLREGGAGRCEIEDGPSLAVETARRLACDASIVAIVEDEHGEPLNIGRKTRSIPPALHRALRSRDKGCRFPGCCNTRYVDAHHIQHWAHGGETKLSNLVTLCRFHHRAVHEGKVVVHVLNDGAIRFLQPDGQSFDSVALNHTHPIGDWCELPKQHEGRGIAIDARTAITRWDGEPMDFGMGVDGLLRRWREGKRNPPAGGSEQRA